MVRNSVRVVSRGLISCAVLTAAAVTALGNPAAHAEVPAPGANPPAATATAPTATAPATEAPAPLPPPPPAVAPKPAGLAPAAPVPALASPEATGQAVYGVALRARWVSLPKWALNAFTKANTPLSSYHVGAEFFRRKGDYDLVLGLAYQNMSPPDGNWLGSGKDPSIDTDYVQFKGLGLVSFDVALIWRQAFNAWAGMHYGGGIGIGVVTGKVLRTSSYGCTNDNLGDVATCHPKGISPLTDMALQATEGGIDTPDTPHRFKDSNIPSVLPVLNLVVGLDFKLPTIPGLELRIDAGFFDALFLGGAVAYVFP